MQSEDKTKDDYRAQDYESLPLNLSKVIISNNLPDVNISNINYLRYRIFDPKEQLPSRQLNSPKEQDVPEYYNYESLP